MQEEDGAKIYELGPTGLADNVVDEQILPDDAKSPTGSYYLPTGHLDENGDIQTLVVVREITGYEEDILASTKTPVWKRLEQVLQNCVLSIGPIKAENNPNWPRIISKLTVGDRLFLILKIRTVSLGPSFRFKTQCTNPACRQVTMQVVNLDDFKITGLPDPKTRHWKGTLPRSKKSYTARVQTGAEEERVTKLAQAHPEDLISIGLLARLLDLGGIQPVKLEDIKKLGSFDREHLRNDLAAHEGIVDNEVDVSCPSCEQEFKTAVNIGSASFFFPSVS